LLLRISSVNGGIPNPGSCGKQTCCSEENWFGMEAHYAEWVIGRNPRITVEQV
jgi:hypothetical protein